MVAGDGVLCDLTTKLAGQALPVECLLKPSDDPHQVQLSPRQSAAVHQARLLLINGYGLTPALARLPGAVPVAELAVPQSPRVNRGRDPHVWHDPHQAAAMTALVSGRLQALEPRAASAIRGREQLMRQALRSLDGWNQRQFASLPLAAGQPQLAGGHRAFASLGRRYNLRELAVIDGSSGGETLRPQALAATVAQLRQQRVKALFSEQWPASQTLSRISQLSGVPLAPAPLRADGLEPTHGDLMVTLTENTCLIVDQQGGHCDRNGKRQLIEQWQAIR